MQTKLEVKAIKKRTDYSLKNSTTKYGVNKDVTGKSLEEGKGYEIDGKKAVKGGDENGTLSNHINTSFDFSKGGSNEDKFQRDKQLGYVIQGINSYSKDNFYSDADNILINTDDNKGQVIIY